MTNTGTLTVEAMTKNGGLRKPRHPVTGNGTGLPPVTVDDPLTPLMTRTFTFTNDGGTIVVRQSTDGGASWQRGMAIESMSANRSVINLLGDGDIYGNIQIADGDDIFVADGETSFDGIVGPQCIPAGGPAALDLDSVLPGVGSNCGVGTLTIQDGGTLFLRDRRDDPTFADMYDGPSYVFVETFNVDDGGTIAFELSPTNMGTQPVGTYPQVFADVANLDGTLEARFVRPTGSSMTCSTTTSSTPTRATAASTELAASLAATSSTPRCCSSSTASRTLRTTSTSRSTASRSTTYRVSTTTEPRSVKASSASSIRT